MTTKNCGFKIKFAPMYTLNRMGAKKEMQKRSNKIVQNNVTKAAAGICFYYFKLGL
jgi:hypothetical protein